MLKVTISTRVEVGSTQMLVKIYNIPLSIFLPPSWLKQALLATLAALGPVNQACFIQVGEIKMRGGRFTILQYLKARQRHKCVT